jgi:hypothetical protein
MNRKYSTIMSLENHRAAARELNIVHVGVMRFEHAAQRKEWIPARVFSRLQRIQRDIDKIHVEMQAVQVRTLPHDARAAACWQKPEWRLAPKAAPSKPVSAMPPAMHIASARILGGASRAMLRFLMLVSKRNHLPVRIMDIGLEIKMFVHLIRDDMHHVWRMTQPHVDSFPYCWVGHFNYFDGD